MVNYTTSSLNLTFSALADPTRRAILEQLTHGEASVTAIAKPFPISLPAISKHLKILEKAGLIVRRREGRTHIVQLQAKPMEEAAQWLAFYRRAWEDTFDALDDYLNKPEEE